MLLRLLEMLLPFLIVAGAAVALGLHAAAAMVGGLTHFVVGL